jgi:hypothetical protein
LSVSTSTSSSPRVTESPGRFSHFNTVASSMESDNRGIPISTMLPTAALMPALH